MTIDRAIQILDPDHREQYDSLETVKEACRMGMEALEKMKSPLRAFIEQEVEYRLSDVFFADKDNISNEQIEQIVEYFYENDYIVIDYEFLDAEFIKQLDKMGIKHE